MNVSATEEALHDAIWLLSGGENRAVHVLTAGLSFRVLVEKLGALCKELGTARVPVEEVAGICSHLHKLNGRRNAIIHFAWSFRTETAEPERFKRTAKVKSGFLLNVTDIEVDEVLSLAEDFRRAEAKLWEIVPKA